MSDPQISLEFIGEGCGAMLVRLRAMLSRATIWFRIASHERSGSCICGNREPICGLGSSRSFTTNMSTRFVARSAKARRSG